MDVNRAKQKLVALVITDVREAKINVVVVMLRLDALAVRVKRSDLI
mgnify:CR=1 FL=1